MRCVRWRTVSKTSNALSLSSSIRGPSTTQTRCVATGRPFEAGDVAILRLKRNRNAPAILTRPLKPGRRIESHRGILPHEEIIGKHVREVVRTAELRSGKPQNEYRLHEVTLDEYVKMSRRLVTPIYPDDANLIANLFDLHPDPAGLEEAQDDTPNLEILEAGTGHGALTLYLSRAIHAANPPLSAADAVDDSALAKWKESRRAIIHTIEISEKYSAHAKGIVQGFRRGMYARNVDFHVGSVGDWVADTLSQREGQAFLSHAFLDLPNTQEQVNIVAEALKVDGTLIVFNPSITQIMDTITKINTERIPLELDKVIELGVNAASGGREWDVRSVRPRAVQKALQEEAEQSQTAMSTEDGSDSSVDVSEVEQPVSRDVADVPAKREAWAMVCRPKVGERVVGGGFLGVFKRMRPLDS